MDKIFSARLDESVIHSIGNLARRLHTTKKNIIEQAVNMYMNQIEQDSKQDIFKQTCGAWKRKESSEQTVKKVRKSFSQSMRRYQK